jgi:hypothetical protein
MSVGSSQQLRLHKRLQVGQGAGGLDTRTPTRSKTSDCMSTGTTYVTIDKNPALEEERESVCVCERVNARNHTRGLG